MLQMSVRFLTRGTCAAVSQSNVIFTLCAMETWYMGFHCFPSQCLYPLVSLYLPFLLSFISPSTPSSRASG